MLITCKYPECGYEGDAREYVGFFPVEKIMEAHKKDPYMPKYGVHLGVDCPKCGKWQRWIKQEDSTLLIGKFYLERK